MGTNVRGLVGNPCPRISSSRMYTKHLFNIYKNYPELNTNEITFIQTNQERFGYPQTLTSTKKNDSTAYKIVTLQLYYCILQLKYIINWPFSLHNFRIYITFIQYKTSCNLSSVYSEENNFALLGNGAVGVFIQLFIKLCI